MLEHISVLFKEQPLTTYWQEYFIHPTLCEGNPNAILIDIGFIDIVNFNQGKWVFMILLTGLQILECLAED